MIEIAEKYFLSAVINVIRSLFAMNSFYIFLLCAKAICAMSTTVDINSALCGLIGSTNIQSLYSQWTCSSAGVANSPCTWTGLTCAGSDVTSISLPLSNLIGENFQLAMNNML